MKDYSIKLFNTHDEYEVFANSDEYIEPHVSFCENEVPSDGRKYCVQYNKKKEPSFEMVDLGLPSGLLWAKCNVGATSEEEYGLYFQWGDTVGYTGDDAKAHSYWSTTPFNGGNANYDSSAINQAIADGKIDATTGILKPQYDAATVHMGSQYHMPTYGDFMELLNNTYQEMMTINNVTGTKFINKSDSSKYIFIPDVKPFIEGHTEYEGAYLMWGSSLNMVNREEAFFGLRYYAVCVRGVLGASDPTPFIGGEPE